MELKLKVLEGTNAGQLVPVSAAKFIIGRAEDCHLRAASDMISRHHCVIMVDDGFVGVRDFGSRNGTYINDQRIAGECELKAGDRLSVGPLRFEVQITHKVGGKKRPPVADLKEAVKRTAAGVGKDLDVSDWLADDTSPSIPLLNQHDTQRMPIGASDQSLHDTRPTLPMDSFSQAGESGTMAANGGPANGGSAEAADKKPTPGKKGIGKLPPIPKTASKDSRDAASQMLDQLRRRR